jgi:hypothetical protein
MKATNSIVLSLSVFCAFAAACGDAEPEQVAAASTAAELSSVGAADAGSQCVDAGPTGPGISETASPEEALEAYACMRTGTSLTVQLTRRGVPLTIEYAIK